MPSKRKRTRSSLIWATSTSGCAVSINRGGSYSALEQLSRGLKGPRAGHLLALLPSQDKTLQVVVSPAGTVAVNQLDVEHAVVRDCSGFFHDMGFLGGSKGMQMKYSLTGVPRSPPIRLTRHSYHRKKTPRCRAPESTMGEATAPAFRTPHTLQAGKSPTGSRSAAPPPTAPPPTPAACPSASARATSPGGQR